jgi:hypothetical protein
MMMRWNHLVTYAASRCLPPPHCLVDCRLSPSSWPATTIIVVISILHLLISSFTPLYCHVFLLLLYSISVGAAYFSASSPSPPASPPPCPSPSYLHRVLLDCCVLMVVVIVCCCLISLLLLTTLTEPPPPRPSTSHSHLPLPPQSHLFLPP